MRLHLFFFSIATSLHRSTSLSTLTVLELGKEVLDIVQQVLDIAEFVDVYDTPQDKKLFGKLDDLTTGIGELSNQFHQIGEEVDMIRRLTKNVGSVVRLEQTLNDIGNTQIYLNQYFQKMEQYILDYEDYDNSTLIDFANNVVSSMVNSVPNLMDFIYRKMIKTDFLELLSQQFEPDTINFCRGKQSLSQVLHDHLNQVLLLNTKSFVVTQAAYLLKKRYLKGSFKREMNNTLNDFQERNNNLINAYQSYIAKASLELWKCHPEHHVEGTTFIQIRNFLHGFILNKVNLDPESSCVPECDTYNYVTKTECFENEWCKKQTTCPKIFNCRYVDQSMTVYEQNINRTNRRYDHIDFGNGLTYGKKNVSSDGRFLETYFTFTWTLRRCSYCFCLCEEGEKFFTEKYINMRLTTSNITENKVVTGLRFVKHNGIIHLQIQEGKVMEKGKIDLDTIRWVPPHNYSRTDNVTEGIDYHALSWNQREFELKDITVENGYVITGVRFLKIKNRLHLEALKTRYDIETGNLTRSYFQEDENLWIRQKFGKQLILKNPNIPTRSSKSDVITTDKYVEFTHSDFEKDAGQTTVPFFDAQPVESAIPVPLSGVGVFHRGRDGYGGFIAPRIFTYNFTQYLTSVFPVEASANQKSDSL